MDKILVATDFSPCSDAAIDLACDLAARQGATLTLLHVCQLPSYAYYGGGLYMAAPDLVESIRVDAERGLAAASARVGARGINSDSFHFVGEPAEEIVRFARQHAYPLIVLGTHGRRGLRRFLLGSVAEQVVRMSEVPVLTWRAPGADGPAHAG
jgi:nucleotide-binding universal stress UspA family protein